MRHYAFALPALLAFPVLLGACSTDTFSTVDASTDAATETGADASPDAPPDAALPSWELLAQAPGPTFRYRALRVQTPNDVWLAGAANNVAALDHLLQGSHNVVPVPGYTAFQALDMKGPNDGVAVGDGGFASYNGTTWAGFPHAKGNMVGVWYSMATNSYFAANVTGRNFKLNGTTWLDTSGSPPPSLTCNAMAAMITVCNNGVIIQYDAQTNAFDKQLTGSPTQADFRGIDRQGTTLAVGTVSTVADVSGSGYTLATMPFKAALNAVWIAASSEVFAVGDGGVIVHRAAGKTEWDQMTSPTTETLRAVGGIELNGKLTVYAAGDGGMLVRYVR